MTCYYYKTRSEPIKQLELEFFYQAANQEIDDDFEVASSDGLDENEAW